MANTYTQINIHAIFAVKHRENKITEKFSNELFKYISGILKKNNQFALAVNGYKDHVHLFFEMPPTYALSDVIRIVKTNSSKWINENNFLNNEFAWQEGFGGFSYSKSQQDSVIKYIMQQVEHHKKQSFRTEYLNLLKKYNIKFEKNYAFEFFDK